MPPTLLLIGVLMVPPPTVVVPLDALAPPEADPFEPPIDVIVDAVTADLDLGDETAVDITWTLHMLQPAWVDLPVSGADLALDQATLDGLPVALPAGADGIRRLTARLDGDHVLRVTGTVFTPQRSLGLPLLPASRGLVQVGGGDWDVEIDGAVTSLGTTWDLPPVSRLAATWKPAAPPAPRPVVVTTESATAVRLGAGGLEGTATLRYLVRHGTVDSLSFELAGPTDHLAVEGTGVREFTRSGTRVDVALSRPTRGHVTLTVSYRAPPPEGDDATAIPIPVPPDSQGSWVTVLQSDQSLVAPDPRAHLEAVASNRPPVWARGLADGTPVVTYRVNGRSPVLEYRLLLFEPVEEPPTLVDEARYEVAYTGHGRVLMRARYQVRNDRNQYLRVTTPPGFTAMGVRVAGDVVQPVAAGGDLLVPLEKSVETLHGLVTFPVEIFFWGQEEAWERRGVRILSTPAVDAPVAYARWEIIMPPGVEARQTEGIPTLVPNWTSKQGGLAYGQSYGDELQTETVVVHGATTPARRRKQRVVRSPAPIFGLRKPPAVATDSFEPPPPPPEVEQAFLEDASQEAWNMAYRAYQDNDFDEAAGWLDESLQLNADNSAAVALKANVDVLLGSDKGDDAQEQGASEVMERRIRDMARARTQGEAVKQEKAKKKAEHSLRAGDLESARAELESLVEITRELAQVEQAEAFDQKSQLAEYSRQLEEIDELEGRRRSREDRGKSSSWKSSIETEPSSAEVGGYDSRTVIDFEEVTIAGELDRWESDGDGRDLGRFQDEDGQPDMDSLMALGYVTATDDGEYDLPSGSFAVELVPEDSVDGLGGGGGGGFTLGGATTSSTEIQWHEVAEVPEVTEEEDEEAPAKDRGPVTTARLTDVVTRPELGVVASQLTLQIPRAGQSLRLEQRLIPENTPLTLEVGFRPDRRSP
jgi:hypothetical protein